MVSSKPARGALPFGSRPDPEPARRGPGADGGTTCELGGPGTLGTSHALESSSGAVQRWQRRCSQPRSSSADPCRRCRTSRSRHRPQPREPRLTRSTTWRRAVRCDRRPAGPRPGRAHAPRRPGRSLPRDRTQRPRRPHLHPTSRPGQRRPPQPLRRRPAPRRRR